ncbi:hypothetical protein [Nostoc sp. DedSLP03]|uniref:hypothetical protein n=1 Tax=Nostoc sp. DedSLP03 TaxID=3075400 RepID=UPI003A0FECB2
MEIIRVEVIKPVGCNRKFQPLWLAWLGQTMPVLEDLTFFYFLSIAAKCKLVQTQESKIILIYWAVGDSSRHLSQ